FPSSSISDDSDIPVFKPSSSLSISVTAASSTSTESLSFSDSALSCSSLSELALSSSSTDLFVDSSVCLSVPDDFCSTVLSDPELLCNEDLLCTLFLFTSSLSIVESSIFSTVFFSD